MKKKFSLLLLAILIVPFFALWGCNDASYFSISTHPNWSTAGEVNGDGTFKEGSTVTLKATAFKNYWFVGWVFQEDTLLAHERNGYSIENTESDGKITQSTLTFSSSSATQGNYMAVFSDENMEYTKFDSFKISVTSATAVNLTQTNFSLWQNNNYEACYSVDGAKNETVSNEINHTAEGVYEILTLSATKNLSILVDVDLIIGGQQYSKNNLRAEINYMQNTSLVQRNGYSYVVGYENGVYEIDFVFNLDTEKTCTVALVYKNLDKFETAEPPLT